MPISPFAIARVSTLVAFLFAWGSPAIRAQCVNTWLPGDGLPGTSADVRSVVEWDPDGAGPLPARVVVGGPKIAGKAVVNGVAAFDPATGTWSSIGAGVNGSVRAVLALPNGDLIVGGVFQSAGGVSANSIARWNGTSWSPLGAGVDYTVNALALLPNGDVIAAGQWDHAGGIAAKNIARWDGQSWSPLGSGLYSVPASISDPPPLSVVNCLLVLQNGDVLASGKFNRAGGVAALNLARWNGSTWTAIASGMTSEIKALAEMPNGDLVIGGAFNMVLRINGSTWSSMGTGGPVVHSLLVLPNGDLLCSGTFQGMNGVSALHIARWSNGVWSPLGAGISAGAFLSMVRLQNGDVVGGGWCSRAGSTEVANIARWNGSDWFALGSGSTGIVNEVASAPNGDLVVAGPFQSIAGVPAKSIARWNGSAWSSLGSGISASWGAPEVWALAALPNGDVVAGGWFTAAGGLPASNVARWNGASWSAMGFGIGVPVVALAVMPNGDVIAAAHQTQLMRWNGFAWGPLAPPVGGGSNPYPMALLPLANGDLIVGGSFSNAGGVPAKNIARWNGVSWSALGAGLSSFGGSGSVGALVQTPNGDIVAGGLFNLSGGAPANNVARWDGVSWSTLGSDVYGASALLVLPNGDVVAAGNFTYTGPPIRRISRWNGSSWAPLAGDVDNVVYSLAMNRGELVAVGIFDQAGSQVATRVAHLGTSCPASSIQYGLGCSSSGGGNALTAVTSPWVDAVFRATGTGLPTTAIVLTLTSVTPVPQALAPLSIVFSQAVPGCDILVFPDILTASVITNGTLQSSLFLPNTPPLVGVTFYHQMVPIELDAQGNWLSVTATNALQLTVGMY